MHITILGRVPSKKNSKQIVCRGKFPMLLSSAKYQEWHVDASRQLMRQKVAGTFPIKKCSMTIEFYLPDARKTDLTNKAESIMDLLVDNGIIEDDNCHVVPFISLYYFGIDRVNPRAEIKITI